MIAVAYFVVGVLLVVLSGASFYHSRKSLFDRKAPIHAPSGYFVIGAAYMFFGFKMLMIAHTLATG